MKHRQLTDLIAREILVCDTNLEIDVCTAGVVAAEVARAIMRTASNQFQTEAVAHVDFTENSLGFLSDVLSRVAPKFR